MKISHLREILDRHELHLSRDLGQNFLVDEQQAHRLAQLAGVREGDSVIEVGTGLGALTRALVDRGAKVVSVEIDAGVVRALRDEALLPEGVELIHGDALQLDLGEIAGALPGPVKLVANLPYSAASPLLRRLLDLRDRLADWSVMLQRELARRLVAKPGNKDYGSFTVLHQLMADVHTAMDLSARCFFPVPKVDSTFLHITPRPDSSVDDVSPDELRRVERVVRAAFGQRRKTMMNGLLSAGIAAGGREQLAQIYRDLELDERVRAEMLAPQVFLEITRTLDAHAATAKTAQTADDDGDPGSGDGSG